MSKTQDSDRPRIDTSTLEHLKSIWTPWPEEDGSPPVVFESAEVRVGEATGDLHLVHSDEYGWLTLSGEIAVPRGKEMIETYMSELTLTEMHDLRAVLDELIMQWPIAS